MKPSTEDYKDTLNKLRKQLVSSRFLRWWLGEISGMAPAWTRSAKIAPDQFVTIPLEQVNAQWSGLQSGDKRPIALTLPTSRVLRKTIALPLATEENLRQVLEFQMEQQTPFSPSQVYFGYSVVGRNFEQGNLSVELVVTPKDAVDNAIKILTGLDSAVRAVFVEDMWASGNLVSLLPAAVARAPSPLLQGVNPWLVAMVGLMAVAAMAMPLVIKREAVVQMLPWVERGKNAAEVVDKVRRELDARIDQHNYLLERRQMTPTVIQALEELTRILPDDTWVLSLDIKGKELQIQGETASSVRLIGLFEQSSMFRDASFRSPLTKGQASGVERYQLALQIRPPAPPLPVVPAAPQVAVSAAVAVASSPVQPASLSTPPAISGGQKP